MNNRNKNEQLTSAEIWNQSVQIIEENRAGLDREIKKIKNDAPFLVASVSILAGYAGFLARENDLLKQRIFGSRESKSSQSICPEELFVPKIEWDYPRHFDEVMHHLRELEVELEDKHPPHDEVERETLDQHILFRDRCLYLRLEIDHLLSELEALRGRERLAVLRRLEELQEELIALGCSERD